MSKKPTPGEPDAPKTYELTRRDLVRIASAVGVAGAVGGIASREANAGPKTKIDTPVVTCGDSTNNTITLRICAPSGTGATGLPAGFSVQWMTCEDYVNNGNKFTSDETRLCKASFSGNANGTRWNLAAGACVDVVIGGLNDADPGVSFTCNDPLDCGGCYVFRAFGHATSSLRRSDFTATRTCYAADCEEETCDPLENGDFCTKSQGFYGGNGGPGRDQLIACFGGDPTGATCPDVSGTTIVTLGGGTYTYVWTTTATCTDVQPGGGVFLMNEGLAKLRQAMGGGGASGFFTTNGTNATDMGAGGGLASQAAALTLNIALSGNECSDFPGGYGDLVLCGFEAGDTFKNDGTPISAETAAALNGQTVQDVLDATNAYLGGNGFVPLPYALATAGDLNELVANLNLAFDGEFDDEAGVHHGCGGQTSFALDHLRIECCE